MQVGSVMGSKGFSTGNGTVNGGAPILPGQPQHDLDVEAELKHLLSQKDLATTLAENLLKHFGSEEMEDVKEGADSRTPVGSTHGGVSNATAPVGKFFLLESKLGLSHLVCCFRTCSSGEPFDVIFRTFFTFKLFRSKN